MCLGSPFVCDVHDLSRVTVSDSLSSGHVGVPLSFDIHHWGLCEYYNEDVPLDVSIAGTMLLLALDVPMCHTVLASHMGSSVGPVRSVYTVTTERKYYTYRLYPK